MNKSIFQEITDPLRRAQMIDDNCETVVENHEYRRQFEPEEVEHMEHTLSEALVKIHVLEEKLATVKADFKDQMDPIKESIKTTVKNLREGSERIVGTCYLYREDGEIGIYSPAGHLISTPRKDQGIQKTIKMKEGTNG